MPTVTFARERITIEVPAGTPIRDAAKRCNINLYSHVFRLIQCYGFGLCGECRVIVTDGVGNLSPVTENETKFKRPSQSRHKGTFGIYVDDGERLPCQARVHGPVTVWTRPRDGGPPPR